ncbi:hypothetical protein B0T16DRAFT_331615 [Cercophora newfieldiana]|uniref:Uncharacterized protein n=1 Tax=Cercophora newfieldiana TaxID=92897 RepID=A0AA39Y0M0_9PEZI|nr:hypothetical protein B0T16DRAFT_331615 [Cercophora newfieldiana]
MLASSSQITRRAGCIHPSSLRSLGTSNIDALRRHHQTRGFRFGRGWGLYFESEPQQDDIYRRHRSFRYKYTEALYQKHQGGNQSLAQDARSALRRMADEHEHSGYGSRRFAKRRNSNVESTLDNPEGVRPGQNIEDVERAPMEHLLFGDRPPHETPDLSKASDVDTAAGPNSEYFIDPITNRRVAKQSPTSHRTAREKEAETPSSMKELYKSQFSSLNPPAFEVHETPDTVAAPNLLAGEPLPKLSSAERQPVLESERYVAEINDTPTSSLFDTLSEKQQSVFWHPSDVIAPTPSNQVPTAWVVEPNTDQNSTTSEQGPGLDQSTIASRARDPTEQYKDLDQYDAVRYLEPNGKTAEHERVTTYDDLDKYGAFRSHEPDGMYKPAKASVDPEELNQYKPFRSCEPDGKYAESYTEEKLDADELARYDRPYLSHEPDGKYAESYGNPGTEDAELPEYEPFRSDEPDGKYANKSVGTTVSPKELEGYVSAPAHELDGKTGGYVAPKADSEELGKYQAFRSHEPNGKYAVEAESSKDDADLGGNHEAFGYEDAEVTPSPPESQGRVDAAELRKYNAIRYNEPDGKSALAEPTNDAGFDYDLKHSKPEGKGPEKTHYRKMLESFMAQSANQRQAATRPSDFPTLTGNYVRDFPEEFAKSWRSTDNSDPQSTLLPTDFDNSSSPATAQETVKSTSALEPALDRHHIKSKSRSTSESIETKTTAEPAVAAAPRPTLYKVLVYDPTMQCIDIAETTSVVSDTSTPLTPAEVLLRISNPAKFLPHFGPLQAQGFEIVSGAGDVLIFRKVGAAAPETVRLDAASHSSTEPVVAPSAGRPVVNPIDMTGGPRDYTVAAGRFASPTGFVNYNLPPSRFESGIDVRREEPVFSGAKEKPNKEGKKSLPRRLAMGALWVGAASYSIGVVGEYFKTGGSDGKGPKGL